MDSFNNLKNILRNVLRNIRKNLLPFISCVIGYLVFDIAFILFPEFHCFLTVLIQCVYLLGIFHFSLKDV